ncbi:ABC transporter permease [Novilysobacter spongiicola]|uniref:Putative ABC transport system permease protein n=1 Tax=Lysobacter spongiicola DSM 21749 TaxID=1122188 RepID=A0A1T4QMV4_9GAMM|nr:ABC transporter permease [Lysobacter spongiicola]SKA04947.1 putative ABC transport system permease protein [Lysobacter spongiicola DSM 21749]
MFTYYFDLALRSFKRNRVLTALMVLAIALGIGASMTTLTVFHVLSGDPIPSKSERLFYPQLEPRSMSGFTPGDDPSDQMTRFDAEALLRDARGDRQAIMAGGNVAIEPERSDLDPMSHQARYATAEFFDMFEVPFLHGQGWSKAQDEARARVVVISQALDEQLFDGANSVGRAIRIDGHTFEIIGVVEDWAPQPMFFDITRGRYNEPEQVYVPFWTSRDLQMGFAGNMDCWDGPDDDEEPDPEGNYGLNAACAWLQYWVEMDPSRADDYRQYLVNYSEQQRVAGRFERPTNVRLFDVMGWLDNAGMVPGDVRLQMWLAFGFLLVCLLNTVGLLLAKFMRRSTEIGVRRALGASRRAIFAQCLVEAGTIGLAGGIGGLGFALLGLWAVRQQPADFAPLAHIDLPMLLVTFVLAILASLLAGLLPAWRACQVAPAIQLKSQ